MSIRMGLGAGALGALLVAIALSPSCTRDHKNPLDPANDDPFDLRAEGQLGGVRLAWDVPAVPGLDSTVVFRMDSGTDTTSFLMIARVACPESVYTDRNVSPDVRYEYQVASYARGETSRRSGIVPAYPRGVDAPYGVVVRDEPNDQGTCLIVEWQLSPMDTVGSEITGYVVARDTVLEGSYPPVATVAARIGTVTDCGLTPGKLYYYRVSALADTLLSHPAGPHSANPVDNIPPRPATALTATDRPDDAGTAIVVAWELSPDDGTGANDVSLYEIYRGFGPDSTTMSRVGTVGAGSADYADEGLQPGSIFHYRVRAKDSTSLSAFSTADSSMAVNNGAPEPPGNLQALNPSPDGGGRIQLLWQKSPSDNGGIGIDGYRLYRTTESGVYGNPLTSVAPGTTEYVDTGVVDLTPYFYRVTAFEGSMESAPSNEAGPVSSDDEMAPAAIRDLQAVPGQLEGEAILTWTAPGDNGDEGTASAYFVKFAADSIATETAWNSATAVTQGVPAPSVAGTPQQMTARGLPTTGEVWFCIRSTDARENMSPFSNAASTSAQADVTPPGYVANLAATQQGALEGQVLLTWTATGDDGDVGTATRYEIRASQSPITTLQQFQAAIDLPNPPVPKPSGQEESFAAAGLTPTVKYYFRLRVLDEVDNASVMSAQATEFAQSDVTPPAPIDDLSASGTAPGLVEGQVLLTWTATGDDSLSGSASTYHLKYRQGAQIGPNDWDNPACITVPVPFPPASADEPESLVVSSLTPGIWYFFAIRAEDDAGIMSGVSNSPQSMPQVDVTRPARVDDLIASGNAPTLVEGQIQLTWTAVGDDSLTGTVSGYEFRYQPGQLITEFNWNTATVLQSSQILRGPSLSPPLAQDTLIAKNLTSGAVLYFACKAFDDHANESAVSNSPSDTVQVDVTPPAKVTTLQALTGPSQGTLKARWVAVGDDSTWGGPAVQYDLRYRTGSPITTEAAFQAATQAPDEPVPSEPDVTDSLLITGLPPDVVHYIALKVRDDAGNWSVLSNSPGVASGADLTPPPDVITFAVQSDDGKLHLAWTPPTSSDYEGVLIGRRRGQPVNTNPVPRVDYEVGQFLPDGASTVVYIGTGTQWSDISVVNDSTYYYRAYSYDMAWNYSEGRQASGTPADTTSPAPVTDFTARQVQEGIRLTWNSPSTADFQSVMVRYGTASYPATPTSGTLLGIEPGTPSTPDSILHASPVEQRYFYSAFAMDEVPNYSTAKTDSATYDVTAPGQVLHLAIDAGDGVDTLSWENPADPDRIGTIVLRRETDPVVDLPVQGEDYAGETAIGTSAIVAILGPSLTTVVDTDLTNGQNYYYAVLAFDWRFNYAEPATGSATPEP
ncbi:hypothetical protein JXA88_15225 [Candidatus Fermentibacteria bacterium]|nr:hypothetical protein [Candidatus Fermentibacteria bacterium]